MIFGGLVSYFYVQYARLTKTAEKVRILEIERTVAEDIKIYNRGVCLIQGGAFYFFDEETGEPLMMMGMGQRGIHEYTGTGFLVSADGLVLTIRHIAEPWWEMSPYIRREPMLKPRFEVFQTFFPGIKEPFDLKVEKISDEADVALLRIDMRGSKIPSRELDTTGKGAVVGEPMMLLGYPAGVNVIFANTDPVIVKNFLIYLSFHWYRNSQTWS